LGNRKESSPENNIANGPSVFQRTKDQDQLRDDVDDCANQRPENVDDPESQRVGVFETRKALEGRNGNKKRGTKDSKARNP
jgi:hypothetical protein